METPDPAAASRSSNAISGLKSRSLRNDAAAANLRSGIAAAGSYYSDHFTYVGLDGAAPAPGGRGATLPLAHGIGIRAYLPSAVESHRKAARAMDEGRFKDQIVPIELKTRKGVEQFTTDEHVRKDAKLEDMAKLKAVFKKEGGTVTAANASGINDAAAAIVLMEAKAAERRNLRTARAHQPNLSGHVHR